MDTCSDLAQLVSDYLEARLTPADASAFEAHLRLCPPCVRYVDQMRTTRAALGRLPPVELPASVAGAMTEHFRAWKRSG